MGEKAKIKSLENIEINHNDWYMILQGLQLKERKLREDAFYTNRPDNYPGKVERLIELIIKVEKIVNITEPPSIKRARTSVKFK